AQADQQLALGLCDDACDASPGLTCATRSWFPTTLLLAVAGTARAWAALPWEEATLSRGLLSREDTAGRTAGAVGTFHVPPHSYIGDLVSHSNAKARRPAAWKNLIRRTSPRGQRSAAAVCSAHPVLNSPKAIFCSFFITFRSALCSPSCRAPVARLP